MIDLKLIDKNVTPASFAGKIHRIKEKLNLTQTKTSLKDLKELVTELRNSEDEVKVMYQEFNYR